MARFPVRQTRSSKERGLCHAKQTVPWTPPTPTSFHSNQSEIKRERSDKEDTRATIIAHSGSAIALSQSQPPTTCSPQPRPQPASAPSQSARLHPCTSQCQRLARPSRTPTPESRIICSAPSSWSCNHLNQGTARGSQVSAASEGGDS